MEHTYGQSIKNLFATGPIEQPIDIDMEKFLRIYGSPKSKKQEFDKQTSRKTDFIKPLNENRFEMINMFPAISSRSRIASCNLAFDK